MNKVYASAFAKMLQQHAFLADSVGAKPQLQQLHAFFPKEQTRDFFRSPCPVTQWPPSNPEVVGAAKRIRGKLNCKQELVCMSCPFRMECPQAGASYTGDKGDLLKDMLTTMKAFSDGHERLQHPWRAWAAGYKLTLSLPSMVERIVSNDESALNYITLWQLRIEELEAQKKEQQLSTVSLQDTKPAEKTRKKKIDGENKYKNTTERITERESRPALKQEEPEEDSELKQALASRLSDQNLRIHRLNKLKTGPSANYDSTSKRYSEASSDDGRSQRRDRRDSQQQGRRYQGRNQSERGYSSAKRTPYEGDRNRNPEDRDRSSPRRYSSSYQNREGGYERRSGGYQRNEGGRGQYQKYGQEQQRTTRSPRQYNRNSNGEEKRLQQRGGSNYGRDHSTGKQDSYQSRRESSFTQKGQASAGRFEETSSYREASKEEKPSQRFIKKWDDLEKSEISEPDESSLNARRGRRVKKPL